MIIIHLVIFIEGILFGLLKIDDDILNVFSEVTTMINRINNGTNMIFEKHLRPKSKTQEKNNRSSIVWGKYKGNTEPTIKRQI